MKKNQITMLAFLLIITLLSLPVAAQTTPAVGPPGEIWVDDDFTVDTPGWGVTHFANLHLATGSVASGGIVHVAPGTYGPVSIDNAGIQVLGAEGAILDGQGHSVDAGMEINVPGVTISGITFRNWSEQTDTAAVRLQSGSTPAHLTTIQDCLFEDNHYGIWGFTNENQIIDNTILRSVYYGIIFTGSANHMAGNRIEDSRYTGIQVQGDGNTITDNLLTGNNTYNSGSWLGAVTVIGNENTIHENEAVDNGRIGIYVLGNTNVISSNEASRNGDYGGWRGIHLFGSHNQIIDNSVRNNNSAGIEIEGSEIYPADQNLLQGNIIMNNRDSGLYIRAGASTVIGNRIAENGNSGIRVMGLAAGSLVSGNVCDNNGDYGIESRGGNRIIGNTVRFNQREESEYVGGGIVAREDDVIHFNNIYGNQPYGMMTWLGAELGAQAEYTPIDARNNWWGHPDGPIVVDLVIPYNSTAAAQEQGDAAAGLLTTAPWLQMLSISAEEDSLTAGQNETFTVTLLNSAGEPAGDNNLSIRIRIGSDPVVEKTVTLHNGQGTFTHRRPTPGTDTVEMALFIAGESTGLIGEDTLTWVEGTTPPADEPEEELPNTGLDMTFPLIGLLLLSMGTCLRRSKQ